MCYVITYVNITEEKYYHYVIVILNIASSALAPYIRRTDSSPDL